MISPNGIRVILFDLDGTLRHSRPSSHQVLITQAIQAGLKEAPEGRFRATRWAHFYWASSPLLQEDLLVSDGDEEIFWKKYVYRKLIAYGCSTAEAQSLSPIVFRYMADEYHPEDYIPAAVPTTLQLLQDEGYTVGIVSNRRESIKEYLETVGLLGYVNFTLVAGEVNSWKPDPVIFQRALQLAGATAPETIYVGDNYYADIIGAQRAGIRPVLLDPDSLFPDAGCDIIRLIEEISSLLV